MSLLVLGGTGTLGRQIVKTALDRGYKVRCFTRNIRRARFLKDWGAEIVYGDLSLPETIPSTLKGISFIIDASTIRPTDDYNAETVDWKGKIALIEAAKLAKIKKFIFFSVIDAVNNSHIPIIDLKCKVTSLLEKAPFSSTIFQCSGFFQGIINQYAIPVLENKSILLTRKTNPIAYLDTQDAAAVVLNDLAAFHYDVRTYAILGKKFWKPEEIIALCERLSGKKAKIVYIPYFILSSLSRFLRFFEFSWNIADRLQFTELDTNISFSVQKIPEANWQFERLGLENYLQDYFGKILKKLKETNYQQMSSNEISFL